MRRRGSPQPTCRSSARRTATTATGRRTSRSSSASGSARTRASSPPSSPRCSARRRGVAARRGRRSRLPQHHARRRRRRRARETHRRRGRGLRHGNALPRRRAINLEFVSANPTGPLHIGGARWAAVGDSPRPALRSRRARMVTREYYFNDHGSADRPLRPQPRRRAPRRADARRTATAAATSSTSRARVELAYAGDLDALAARRAAGGLPRARRQPDVRRDQGEPARLRRRLRRLLPRELRCTSRAPSSTRSSGCASSGHIYEADGATWLRTTEFGDDKDRVVIKSDGAAGVHLRRPRLLPQQARARLRALHHPARRRPPRLRPAPDGDDAPRSATCPTSTSRS